MPKYRKKPVIIEAIQWTGYNTDEFFGWFDAYVTHLTLKGNTLYIPTLEGKMAANVGDFVIKGVKDEFYPCKPDIFEMTYEKVEED